MKIESHSMRLDKEEKVEGQRIGVLIRIKEIGENHKKMGMRVRLHVCVWKEKIFYEYKRER